MCGLRLRTAISVEAALLTVCRPGPNDRVARLPETWTVGRAPEGGTMIEWEDPESSAPATDTIVVAFTTRDPGGQVLAEAVRQTHR